MSDVCLSGLQGFPVQITGWSGYTEKASLAIPNDIQLQFSPSESPMTYNAPTGELTQKSSSGNTFFMGGTLFTVKSIRLAEPKQDGLKNFSANTVAEFQIWGMVNPTGVPKYDVAVITIPLYVKAEESEQGASIMNAVNGQPVRLMDCIPSGKNTMVVRYVTCIETDSAEKSTVKVAVAYFSDGVAINAPQANRLTGRLGKAGIPNVFGFKILSRFEQYNDPGRTKGNRQYLTENTILQAYQTTVALSTSTPEFRQGFRIIFSFIKRDTATEKKLGAYKCIAIDKQRDIKNNQLVVDPKTGRSLEDEITVANQQANETLPTRGNIRDTFMTVAIIVGVILGLTGLALLFMFIATIFFNRKGQGILDPIPANVQKLYDTLPPNIVGK